MMNESIESRIHREYFDRQTRCRAEEDRRLNEVRAAHPDIAALLDQRHSLVMNAARSLFSSSATEDPEARMNACNEEIRLALTRCGYASDYLQPIYECAVCRDTGFVSVNPPVACSCMAKLRSRLEGEERGMLGIRPVFEEFSAEVFPETVLPSFGITQRELMLRYRDRCLRYTDALPAPAVPFLLLTGGSGLGKTFLMNCIADRARKKGLDVIVCSAYKLLSDLKNAYFDRGGEEASSYFDCSLLCIDDLGMEPLMQNVTIEQIYNLLNTRYDSCLPTVITTNLTMDDIRSRYNERIFSRFSDSAQCKVLTFDGADIRRMRRMV